MMSVSQLMYYLCIYSYKTLPVPESLTNSNEFQQQHTFSASINSIKCLQGLQSLPETILLGCERVKCPTDCRNGRMPNNLKLKGIVSPVTTNMTTQSFSKMKTAKYYAKPCKSFIVLFHHLPSCRLTRAHPPPPHSSPTDCGLPVLLPVQSSP